LAVAVVAGQNVGFAYRLNFLTEAVRISKAALASSLEKELAHMKASPQPIGTCSPTTEMLSLVLAVSKLAG